MALDLFINGSCDKGKHFQLLNCWYIYIYIFIYPVIFWYKSSESPAFPSKAFSIRRFIFKQANATGAFIAHQGYCHCNRSDSTKRYVFRCDLVKIVLPTPGGNLKLLGVKLKWADFDKTETVVSGCPHKITLSFKLISQNMLRNTP